MAAFFASVCITSYFKEGNYIQDGTKWYIVKKPKIMAEEENKIDYKKNIEMITRFFKEETQFLKDHLDFLRQTQAPANFIATAESSLKHLQQRQNEFLDSINNKG